jgi:hypothetical protein
MATADPDIIGPTAPATSVATAIPFRNCAVVRLPSRSFRILVSLLFDKDNPGGGPEDFGDKLPSEVAMKALVDRLSADLAERYVHYLETFIVDLWSEGGFVEFRCGFTLRRDHELRTFTLKVDADTGQTDAERDLLIAVVFDEIEEMLDLAIAEQKVDAN